MIFIFLQKCFSLSKIGLFLGKKIDGNKNLNLYSLCVQILKTNWNNRLVNISNPKFVFFILLVIFFCNDVWMVKLWISNFRKHNSTKLFHQFFPQIHNHSHAHFALNDIHNWKWGQQISSNDNLYCYCSIADLWPIEIFGQHFEMAIINKIYSPETFYCTVSFFTIK